MPGLTFTILEAPPTRPVIDDTGTGFMVGITDHGPHAPTLVTSLARFTDTFGGRRGDSSLYDAVESFFAEGGSRLYIARAGGPTGSGSGSGSGSGVANEADYEAALDRITIHYGPGQIAIPGVTTNAAYEALLEHANANNRRAILDGPDSSSTATLLAAVTGLTPSDENDLRFGALWGNWPVIKGLTANTTRTVPPSGVIMGMIARSDRANSPNVPAAGAQTEPRSVLDLSNSFTDVEVDTLADGNVNVFHEMFGSLWNFGWRSLADSAEDPAWLQFSASRLIMAIIGKSLSVASRYLFSEIDGQRRKLAQFEGDLVGTVFLPYYTAGSLYGTTPEEAFSVDVISVEANPDEDLAQGRVRALCVVRPSPFAESIEFQITNVPITQPITV
jgi:hypothetical protein